MGRAGDAELVRRVIRTEVPAVAPKATRLTWVKLVPVTITRVPPATVPELAEILVIVGAATKAK